MHVETASETWCVTRDLARMLRSTQNGKNHMLYNSETEKQVPRI